MSLGFIALIALVLLVIGLVPTWPYSRAWGYGPSIGTSLLVVALLVLLLMGQI